MSLIVSKKIIINTRARRFINPSSQQQRRLPIPIIEYSGNIFNSSANTLVNTVNCVGVMGKGIALDFKKRYPDMFLAYQKVCFLQKLRPGYILPYSKADKLILNFAVKDHWRKPARIEWVESCLIHFVANYERLKITSIAFPHIGTLNGGIPWNLTHDLMIAYLAPLPIDIEIITFDKGEKHA